MNPGACRWFIALPPQGAARFVGSEVVRAFQEQCGASAVKTFDCALYLQAFSNLQKTNDETMTVDLLNQSLAVQCLDFQASHILVLALSPITVFTLNLLRKYGIITVHWFYEDFRMAHYWKDVIGAYSYFFAIQKGPIVDACAKSGSIFTLMPTAASGVALRPLPIPKTVDVGFIGIPSEYRIKTLEHLASRGIRLGIAGLGWKQYRGPLDSSIINREWVHAEESVQLLAQARIGINISVNDPQTDRENTHISPRVFDCMMAGCVLLTEESPLAREILEDCRFFTFSSVEEAVAKTKEIVSIPAMDVQPIEHNRKIVEEKHLFRHRVEKIISLTCRDDEDGKR